MYEHGHVNVKWLTRHTARGQGSGGHLEHTVVSVCLEREREREGGREGERERDLIIAD